ncbi:penicillin-binding protein activator [Hwanghaeella sp. LZ110]|uniref:penicillin-binding protein activator n=1 Tax=Hwanghaeella sp. LZ110 TaxID=3402810 RepID=UPI003B672D26
MPQDITGATLETSRMVSHTATPHLPFQPARLITSVLRPCRSVLPAIFALSTTLIVSACGVSGGSSVWGNAPSGPGLGTPQTPTAQSATRGDAPEGTPGANDALTGMGGSTLALGDSGYLTPPPDAVRQIEGIPVAILVPLSGRLAGPGKALLEGAQMALFDVGNPEFRLMPFDTMGTALGAEQAARSAINKGARLIVGPLLADSVTAVRPIAEAANIKVVAFSNSSHVAGGPIFLAGFTPEEQVDAIVAHAMAEGRRRFAILAPSNEYGNVSVDALRTSVEKRGGEFSRVGFYNPDALDFSEQIQSLSDYKSRVQALKQQRAELSAQGDQASKQALKRMEVLDTWGDPPFDALLLPVLDPQTLQILSAQLAYYDVDQPTVRLLGLQRWDSFPNLASEPGLIGSQFPAARSAYRDQFEARFAQLFGHGASDLSALSYDVTAVAAALARPSATGPKYDVATLTDPQGFIGAEGLFRFQENGIAQRGFAIMEVQSSGVRMIQEAPRSFDQPVTTYPPQPTEGTAPALPTS